MRISESELKRLKKETDLVSLIRSSGVELKKQGSNWLGYCSFHDDKTPSLVVTPSKQLWNCLGACGTGGSSIDWVMKSKGVSFRHAVEILREGQAHMAPTSPHPIKKMTVPHLESPLDSKAEDQTLLNQVIDYYHETLKKTPEAMKYLEKRGLMNPKVMNTFKLGFADRTLGLRLPQKNRKEGAKIRGRLTKLGIYRANGHEHFRGSLVIPIINEKNQITEIYGRKIRDDLRKGTAYHTYLPGPHQGLFNAPCLAYKRIILCESIIDALSFWVHGFVNVTSSYGINGFTEEHLNLFLERGIEEVLIAYDADEAGNQAASELSIQLIEKGISCSRIKFPHNMDANTFILQCQDVGERGEALNQLIHSAEWLGGRKGSVSLRLADPSNRREV